VACLLPRLVPLPAVPRRRLLRRPAGLRLDQPGHGGRRGAAARRYVRLRARLRLCAGARAAGRASRPRHISRTLRERARLGRVLEAALQAVDARRDASVRGRHHAGDGGHRDNRRRHGLAAVPPACLLDRPGHVAAPAGSRRPHHVDGHLEHRHALRLRARVGGGAGRHGVHRHRRRLRALVPGPRRLLAAGLCHPRHDRAVALGQRGPLPPAAAARLVRPRALHGLRASLLPLRGHRAARGARRAPPPALRVAHPAVARRGVRGALGALDGDPVAEVRGARLPAPLAGAAALAALGREVPLRAAQGRPHLPLREQRGSPGRRPDRVRPGLPELHGPRPRRGRARGRDTLGGRGTLRRGGRAPRLGGDPRGRDRVPAGLLRARGRLGLRQAPVAPSARGEGARRG
ncbi:unnamed protein product, partial [Prorocentrum cordatum]